MKNIIVIVLLFTSKITFPQNLKAKLQGEWVCTKIVDTNGSPVSGKFGESNEYLRFSFKKGNLSITEAPFDRGLKIPITFFRDYIDLFPQSQFELPESKYFVKSINDNQLILKTKNDNGNSIEYHFINEKILLDKVVLTNSEIEIGTIVIRHIRYGKNDSKGKGKAITKRYTKSSEKDSVSKVNIVSVGTNRTYEYRIENEMETLFPSPIFDHPTALNLASYISYNITLPENYKSGDMPNELIMTFQVMKGGATNFKIIEGLDDEINTQMIELISTTKEYWKMLMANGKAIDSFLKLHFVFQVLPE